MIVYDPVKIKHYERLLNRKLNYMEIVGQVPVKINNIRVYLDIPELRFPYDFMSETVLQSVSHKILKNIK